MAFWQRVNIWHNKRSGWLTGIGKRFLMILIAVSFVFLCHVSFAAESGKYQVVAGSDDKAYLVDTSTGFIWVLTYRTMATGREPIAIPYKFIKLSPKNQKDFMVESAHGASMPMGESK
jgi:hypothetical protein